MDWSVVPGGCWLWGSSTVGGMATPSLLGHCVVEKLVVGRPPERIVDHDRPVQRSVLQVGTVEGMSCEMRSMMTSYFFG